MEPEKPDFKSLINRIGSNLHLHSPHNHGNTAQGGSLRPGPDGWIRPPKIPPRPEVCVGPSPPFQQNQIHHHGSHGNSAYPSGFFPYSASRPGHGHHHQPHNHAAYNSPFYPQLPHYESPPVYEACPSPQPQRLPSHGSAGYGWRPPSHCTGTFMWVPGVRGEAVPPNAVKVGQDKDGEPIFAGRAFHEGDLLPAKINPTHSAAYVAYGGQEHAKYEYEILCSAHIGWQTADQGAVPPEAICVGQTQCGEKLYLGRTMHDGTLTPGKIQPSHNCLYIPYGGEELSFSDYEVAVLL